MNLEDGINQLSQLFKSANACMERNDYRAAINYHNKIIELVQILRKPFDNGEVPLNVVTEVFPKILQAEKAARDAMAVAQLGIDAQKKSAENQATINISQPQNDNAKLESISTDDLKQFTQHIQAASDYMEKGDYNSVIAEYNKALDRIRILQSDTPPIDLNITTAEFDVHTGLFVAYSKIGNKEKAAEERKIKEEKEAEERRIAEQKAAEERRRIEEEQRIAAEKQREKQLEAELDYEIYQAGKFLGIENNSLMNFLKSSVKNTFNGTTLAFEGAFTSRELEIIAIICEDGNISLSAFSNVFDWRNSIKEMDNKEVFERRYIRNISHKMWACGNTNWNGIICSGNIKTLDLSKTSIEIIPKGVFARTNIESIILPESLTKVEDDAFYDCSNLKTVKFNGTEKQWKKVKIKDSTLKKVSKNITFLKD